MGKFMIKESNREMGISPWNSICQIGSKVNDRYKFGNIAIIFNEIMSARTYINSEVLRRALLENPEKTARLLSIEVKDLKPAPEIVPAQVIEEEVIETVIEEIEPEYAEPDSDIEEVTQELVFEMPVEETEDIADELSYKTKAELVELGNEKGIVLDSKMTKDTMISKLTEEME